MLARFLTSLLLAVSLLTAGCASIPSEAPALSAQLGERIGQIERSHMALLRRFFEQKRGEVDRFIEEEWVPEFSRQFFANESIADAWQTIVREDDKAARLEFLVRLGPQLQQKIQQKRMELIRPLDQLERRIEGRLRAEYQQARAMNNSLTSFLHSASKVTDNRDRYLAKAGASDEAVNAWIDQTDEAVSNLVKGAEVASDQADRAEVFIERTRSIRESIGSR